MTSILEKVNVRRLINVVKSSAEDALESYLFDPNFPDNPLREPTVREYVTSQAVAIFSQKDILVVAEHSRKEYTKDNIPEFIDDATERWLLNSGEFNFDAYFKVPPMVKSITLKCVLTKSKADISVD